MSNDDFGHFGRRAGYGRGDDMDDMREQMAKERDAFFRDSWPNRVGGADPWPNREHSGPTMRSGGYFTTPRSSLSGFPGGGLRREFGEVGSRPAQRPMDDDFSSLHRDSIPISVIHERSAGGPGLHDRSTVGPAKHKYTGTGRNTTELPAKSSTTSNGTGSPRLERAASEPPNKFNQRLNLSRPLYSTIPENSEGAGGNRAGSGSLDPNAGSNNPIKTSASAPNVPDSRGGQQTSARISPPRPSKMSSAGNDSNMNAVPTAGNNVRHIPIFVEGRSEPIFNTNLSAGAGSGTNSGQQNTEMPFPKPSDYYPSGVQRIRSRDDTEPTDTDLAHRKVPIQEPTTPQGPPPGPIPMGYLPNPQAPIPEPTTPQGPPPGPIPMGYLPRVDAGPDPSTADPVSPAPSDATTAETKPDAGNAAAMTQPPPPPIRTKSSTIHPEKENIHPESAESKVPPTPLSASTEQPEQPPRAPSQEPAVNFIPIKVQHGRATSPRPQSTSRPASQEVPNQRQSPRPAGNSPAPGEEPAKPAEPAKDPRIAKLETIDKEAECLGTRVETFQGSKEDKEYRYLEDKLTKLLISADDISTDGISEIRQLRKESCNKLNKLADTLERKASTT